MIIEYLLFIGSGLYLISATIFFYLWIKTLKSKDGKGLIFLKFLSFSLFIGSLIIFTVRILSEYGQISFLTARAIAVINPLILVGVGLYLKYLFNNGKHK